MFILKQKMIAINECIYVILKKLIMFLNILSGNP